MSLTSAIEQGPMTRFQITAITLCMAINMLDGFDVLVVAFTAPSIAADWKLSATALGSLLSAGLAGMTVGSLALGPLADRFGRRPMVLAAMMVISVGMVLSAFTSDLKQLFVTRLLTGLGVGAMLPSLNTIVSEYSSLRWRSFAVSVLQAGYPLGATVGGVIAALLYTTVLLCAAFFVVMLSFYFVLSWTPKLLVDAGMSTSEGISGGIILNVGGILGSMLLGYLSVRIRISKLIAMYMLLTAVLMPVFATVSHFDTLMLVLALALGFFIFGSMVGLYALSPHLFPARSRAAGLSVAIGVGRLGGVLSPLLAGYLFDVGWSRQAGFTAFAAPLLLSMIVVLMLARRVQ